ncbi:hypothetical protein, partial [Sinorhizobium terangae]|uniref:hypothetical protein n=1 Tax=Sinorhizobium terangae TaxID=110322 RepID=UPI001AEEA2C2
PPRLPPSKVCQRGPPNASGKRRAAARIEKPSGKVPFGSSARTNTLRREQTFPAPPETGPSLLPPESTFRCILLMKSDRTP